MTLKSVTTSGKAGKEIASALFDAAGDAKTVAQAVRVFLSNQRQGTAKVKTRGEVDRTKKKWYRQKGTGGARHGARSANIFVGGGVVHGPTGTTDWTLRMSKPMKIAALRAALSMQAKDGNIMVIEGVEKMGAKTKEVAAMLKSLELTDSKTLIVISETHENLIRASRNIESVLCTRADRLNTFEIMNAHKVLMTPEAVTVLEGRLAKRVASEAITEKIEKKAKTVKKAVKEEKPVAKKVVRKTTKKTDK
jgi:large subunit ribosomal protein L4